MIQDTEKTNVEFYVATYEANEVFYITESQAKQLNFI